jgi:arylformamidase
MIVQFDCAEKGRMQLDDAYAIAAHTPGAEAIFAHWPVAAKAFRARRGGHAELAVQYGPGLRQAYDLFHGDAIRDGEMPRGTLVFVHGGYWLRFDRSSWSHLAEGAIAQGWNVAVVEYDLCPDVRIADITDQIARAISHIAGRSTGPLSLTGHSAGGHLVARMLAPGILPAEVLMRIARVVPISPVADLRPLLQTSMNEHFRLDLAAAEAESPVLQPAPDIPVRIWVGEQERPVFLEQAAALAEAWEVAQVIVPDRHHFDVIDALMDPESELVRYLTAQNA